MTPNIDVTDKLLDLAYAASVLGGLCAWWRKDTQEEDHMVAAAADTVLESLSDADTMNKIGCVTQVNLREQLSIEEAINLDEERRLRRFGWGRN